MVHIVIQVVMVKVIFIWTGNEETFIRAGGVCIVLVTEVRGILGRGVTSFEVPVGGFVGVNPFRRILGIVRGIGKVTRSISYFLVDVGQKKIFIENFIVVTWPIII